MKLQWRHLWLLLACIVVATILARPAWRLYRALDQTPYGYSRIEGVSRGVFHTAWVNDHLILVYHQGLDVIDTKQKKVTTTVAGSRLPMTLCPLETASGLLVVSGMGEVSSVLLEEGLAYHDDSEEGTARLLAAEGYEVVGTFQVPGYVDGQLQSIEFEIVSNGRYGFCRRLDGKDARHFFEMQPGGEYAFHSWGRGPEGIFTLLHRNDPGEEGGPAIYETVHRYSSNAMTFSSDGRKVIGVELDEPRLLKEFDLDSPHRGETILRFRRGLQARHILTSPDDSYIYITHEGSFVSEFCRTSGRRSLEWGVFGTNIRREITNATAVDWENRRVYLVTTDGRILHRRLKYNCPPAEESPHEEPTP